MEKRSPHQAYAGEVQRRPTPEQALTSVARQAGFIPAVTSLVTITALRGDEKLFG
jgi:hypothetical protein